jgi:hypothetical protein
MQEPKEGDEHDAGKMKLYSRTPGPPPEPRPPRSPDYGAGSLPRGWPRVELEFIYVVGFGGEALFGQTKARQVATPSQPFAIADAILLYSSTLAAHCYSFASDEGSLHLQLFMKGLEAAPSGFVRSCLPMFWSQT